MFSACVQQSLRGPSVRAAAAVLVLLAAGCKSGGSWNAKPSWWSFGSDDPAKAATAPSTDVAKPSTTAKPYPTTSTPEGYVIEGGQRDGTVQAVAGATAPTTPAAPPAAVTYGAKPVDPPAYASAPPAAAVPPAGPSGLSSISPQVGPYAAPPGATPVPDQPLPSAAAAFAAPPQPDPAASVAMPAPPADGRFGAAGARVADARGGDAWAASSAMPATAVSPESRYATGGGSRFTSPAAMPDQPAALQFNPPPLTPAAAEQAPSAMPDALPATMPAPVATPPSAAPAFPPATPPAVPMRRPDAGYRPAGTSNYSPGSKILAGAEGQPPTAGGVMPASFQEPASP